MSQNTYLRADSIMFWLVALIAASIILIGARFLVSPRTAARDFGVRAGETERSTYLWAKGIRDIVSGLLVAGLLWLKVSAGVLATFLYIAALIPIGDMLKVYAQVRTKNVPALLIHGGTAVFMCVLASFLLRH